MVKIVPLQLETPFAEGFVNAFVVIGDSITLVDTGNPGKKSFLQLKSQLKNIGIRLSDIDQIVLTHMHTDHSGGIRLIQEEISVPVYVHEVARPVITGGKPEFERMVAFYNDFLLQCGAIPSTHQVKREYHDETWNDVHYFSDGEVIQIGGKDFKVIYVPGHSQTDVLLVDCRSGNTIAGDFLITDLSVNAFIEPPINEGERRPKPLLQYRHSLKKVHELELGIFFPGHGETFTEYKKLINQRLQEHDVRCGLIKDILLSGEQSIFEICQKLYPRLKGKTVFLGLSQIQGHLDLLEERLEVRKFSRGSVTMYSLM